MVGSATEGAAVVVVVVGASVVATLTMQGERRVAIPRTAVCFCIIDWRIDCILLKRVDTSIGGVKVSIYLSSELI